MGSCASHVKPIWVYVSAVVISLPVAWARWSCLCKPLSKYITDPGMWANRSTTSYLNSPPLSFFGFLCSPISLSMHSIYQCDTDTLVYIRKAFVTHHANTSHLHTLLCSKHHAHLSSPPVFVVFSGYKSLRPHWKSLILIKK